MPAVHLTLMSKPRLIAMLEEATRQRDAALRSSDHWRTMAFGRSLTEVPLTVERAAAQRILDSLPGDPKALQHRAVLERELAIHDRDHRVGRRRAGDPCPRATCTKQLDSNGLCRRCDWRKFRDLKAVA